LSYKGWTVGALPSERMKGGFCSGCQIGFHLGKPSGKQWCLRLLVHATEGVSFNDKPIGDGVVEAPVMLI
jgi:hypothetical protein